MKKKRELSLAVAMSLAVFAALNVGDTIGAVQAAATDGVPVQVGQAAVCAYEQAIDENALEKLSEEKSNVISVPTTMSELMELGWVPEEADAEVAGGSFYQIAFHKDGDTLYAVVQNWNDEVELFSQLLIYTLSTYDENALTADMIHVGSDEENISVCFDGVREVSVSGNKTVYEYVSSNERYSIKFGCEEHKVVYLEINAYE